MLSASDDPTIIVWLQNKNATHAASLKELRKVCAQILEFVPGLFKHYTDHSVRHSDEIVRQVSNVLFKNDAPTISLSPIEAYLIVAAAYLHDIGMVVSYDEQAALLKSNEWQQWLEKHPKVASAIDEAVTATSAHAPLISNITVRFALSEFFRTQHAARSGAMILELQHELQAAITNDVEVRDALARVCKGHGLSPTDLRDRVEFPDEIDLHNEKANLAFCALLLRLGDLLDLRKERSSTLLRSLSGPLPEESEAHWASVAAIRQRNVTSTEIAIVAECADADQHRMLRNWCQWIVDEVQNANALRQDWRRHDDWVPPRATFDAPATITIKPARRATYHAIDWRYRVDDSRVIRGFVESHSEEAVLRELAKNALDATRRRITDAGLNPLALPVEESSKFQLEIAVLSRGGNQVLTVADKGCGMNEDVVTTYFLQVGNSFYSSHVFRTNEKFYPSSHFGVGFLSVFAVSDHITLTTWTGNASDTALRIVFHRPEDYLLVDRVQEGVPQGTRIEIVLRKPVTPDWLRTAGTNLFGFIELPIHLATDNEDWLIEPTRFESECAEYAVPEGPKFRMRKFPINGNGIRGHALVLSRVERGVEYWNDALHSTWESLCPFLPANQRGWNGAPTSMICDAGLKVQGQSGFSGNSCQNVQLDVRRTGITRRKFTGESELSVAVVEIPEVRLAWQTILDDHIRDAPLVYGTEYIRYMNLLANRFQLRDYWENKQIITVMDSNQPVLMSLNEIVSSGKSVFISTEQDVLNCAAISPRMWQTLCWQVKSALGRERYLTVEYLDGQPVLRSDAPRARTQGRAIGARQAREFHFTSHIVIREVSRGTAVPSDINYVVSADGQTIYAFSGVPFFDWLFSKTRFVAPYHIFSDPIVVALFDAIEQGNASTLDSLLAVQGVGDFTPAATWLDLASKHPALHV